MRRWTVRAVVLTLLAVVLGQVTTPGAAHAAWPWEGDVTNNLPTNANLMYIAEFGTGTQTDRCRAWATSGQVTTYTCRQYYLRPGWTDDDTNGYSWDADGFTFTNTSFRVSWVASGRSWTEDLPAWTYFDLNDGRNAVCTLQSGRPFCRVT
jgi:hypothetical protein